MAYRSALTPFFTRVLLPCFWPHRTALPLPECGGVMRGRAAEDGPSSPMLLSYISGQQDVLFCFYSWQFLPCDNRKKRPSQYHREVLNLSFIHCHHQGCEQDSLKSRLPCLPLCVLLMHSRLSLGFSIWSPPKLLLPWNIPDPLSPSPASSICSQSA